MCIYIYIHIHVYVDMCIGIYIYMYTYDYVYLDSGNLCFQISHQGIEVLRRKVWGMAWDCAHRCKYLRRETSAWQLYDTPLYRQDISPEYKALLKI